MFCADAEQYYYDYLCGLDTGIPRAVAEHIRYCVHCRTQIRQLEAAVAESEAQDRRPRGDTDVIGALSLHFAHIGDDVTCAKAKSFLPALLVPSLTIRIPTPITVHVDHCRQCAKDLEAIRELELRPEQLARLSRLYAAVAHSEPQTCRRTRAKTWAFACASFEGIDAEILDHICVCPRCRRRVYRCRDKILAGRQPGDTIPGVGLCSGKSMADLFEWVVPFGRTGGNPDLSPGEEAVPSHLQACPECIERMQALHRTIYGVAERIDSGVSTVYTATGGVDKSDELVKSPYSDYPIHVEVAYGEPEPVAPQLGRAARAREVLRRGAANPQFRPVMRVVLAAAAMVPLAMALLINIRPASGVSLSQISGALKRVENLHVITYGEDVAKSTREIWASRASGWVITVKKDEQSLYDNRQRIQKAVYLDNGTTETTELKKGEGISPDQAVDTILGSVMEGVPTDLQSDVLTRAPASDTQGDGEAYELTCEGKKSLRGRSRLYMLRIVLDSAGLPKETQSFQKMVDEEQWEKKGTRKFYYPTQEEMDSKAKELFGSW
jgi:hypothetical protein